MSPLERLVFSRLHGASTPRLASDFIRDENTAEFEALLALIAKKKVKRVLLESARGFGYIIREPSKMSGKGFIAAENPSKNAGKLPKRAPMGLKSSAFARQRKR